MKRVSKTKILMVVVTIIIIIVDQCTIIFSKPVTVIPLTEKKAIDLGAYICQYKVNNVDQNVSNKVQKYYNKDIYKQSFHLVSKLEKKRCFLFFYRFVKTDEKYILISDYLVNPDYMLSYIKKDIPSIQYISFDEDTMNINEGIPTSHYLIKAKREDEIKLRVTESYWASESDRIIGEILLLPSPQLGVE